MSVFKILLLRRAAGHLSDRRTFSAGQNENLPVLTGSPAVFAKTAPVNTEGLGLHKSVNWVQFPLVNSKLKTTSLAGVQ